MRKFSKKNCMNRVAATILTLLLAVASIPSSVLTVKAETNEHQDCVTITVKDENGAAIEGAKVTYCIKENEARTNDFETISESKETDANGTIEVLPQESFLNDLEITAGVSKDGYKTDIETIKDTKISAGNVDFVVTLQGDYDISHIEGIQITPNDNLTYQYETEQALISASTTTEGVTIEYSTDGASWSEVIPKGKDAGSYSVYVRMLKDGYNTYLSDKYTITINKADILEIDVTANNLNYIENTSQALVTLSGTTEDDTISWFVNDKDTGSGDIPKAGAVGKYKVKLVVNRGDNYNEFSKEVEVEIKKAKLDVAGLSVKGYDGVYDGQEHPTVEVTNKGDYTLKYQLDSGSEEPDLNAWSEEIPVVSNAGSYIVWVKAVKTDYEDTDVDVTPADNAVEPYNVYIAQAAQTLEFKNYDTAASSVEVSVEELKTGKEYDFSAVDKDKKANGSISYEVVEAAEDGDEETATIDNTGKLTVKCVGEVTIKATLSGNQNYKACTISHTLSVSGMQESGKWISVAETEIDYVLGDKAGIPSNAVKNIYKKDKGTLKYSVENGDALGLSVGNNGSVSVSDYGKLASAIEKSNGTLKAKIVINKAAYTREGWFKTTKFPADSASYTLNISLADAPADSYKLYSADDTEITAPDGDNNWYKSALAVKPADGYSIIRADELTGNDPEFSDKAEIGNKASDQGAGVKRCVYLRDNSTGKITKKIELDVDKLDTVAPNNIEIKFPNTTEKDSVKYYGDSVTVTFVAYDTASGVDNFEWKYIREDGASESILETDSGKVSAQQDTTDKTKYIGKLTLPKEQAEQLRGRLQVKAVDKAGNESISYTDNGVFVVDTIAPNQRIEYKLKNSSDFTQVVGEKHYFSGTVEFKFKITEANFYAEDVVVEVSKDGASLVKQKLSWTNTGIQDEHMATLTLSDDAEYVVTMNYEDRSGKKMTSYTSEKIVIDTIAPAMDVEYSSAANSFENKDYYNNDLTATLTINETNFYKEDVIVRALKEDGTVENLTPVWEDSDLATHIGKVVIGAGTDHSNDGDYVFIVDYKDRSNNTMPTYTSGTKVIDTTKPVINVQYANNNPVNELIDVENHQRKYFAATQTATITITEHNFNASDVTYSVIAKDVGGNVIDASALYSVSSWSQNGDINTFTITYPGDANYTFDIGYTDLAKVQADTYATDYFTVDKTKPSDLTVSYSNSVLDTILNTITFGFYNAKATVTITATDNISGVNSMKYSYVKASSVSGVNTELVDAVVDASGITISNGGAVGTVTFEIPRSELAANSQFNGTVNFTATDRAGNESDYLRDTKRIVVDNIAPNADVQYNTPVQTSNGVAYYDGDITATVTVNEANFYSDDMQISVNKDGTSIPVSTSWTDSSTDVHVGTFTLSADGDYTVEITYSDKSSNQMQKYTSDQMTIDTEITEATITVNGQDADGMAFKDEVVPAVNFDDDNFESCEVKMFRTSFANKNVDVTDEFVTGHISLNETGGSGEFDTFDKIAENDGIYTITTELKDKAGHTSEKSITFTVNRFGSVYEYNDLLVSLISDGGAYVQSIDDDLVITEYNADKLLSDSLDIEILRDGKPLDNVAYTVSPEINDTVSTGDSGWYQYSYTIAKDNFESDGVYKIAVSSEDATGNNPENDNYDDKNILFRVDSTVPEITSVTGLENPVVNGTEQTVKYNVYDTIGLNSVLVYVDDKEVDNISDFSSDENNYSGAFTLEESSSAQKIRFVVTDKAGNVTDTDSDDFTSSYAFNNMVTVSTNVFVRWFANKALFYGTIGGTAAVVALGAGSVVFVRKRKTKIKGTK